MWDASGVWHSLGSDVAYKYTVCIRTQQLLSFHDNFSAEKCELFRVAANLTPVSSPGRLSWSQDYQSPQIPNVMPFLPLKASEAPSIYIFICLIFVFCNKTLQDFNPREIGSVFLPITAIWKEHLLKSWAISHMYNWASWPLQQPHWSQWNYSSLAQLKLLHVGGQIQTLC